ncbi:MAG: bifunctional acyl-CoA synthetase/GNAT family N-acetyltransferase [Xanthobacteraceae bacterium]|nr:MAG: bifunctional acyl-CoA synthetase/GNAT family N-acetyltransferase [Xanthobacteraceae bacterium]
MTIRSLERLFAPRSIAVIGASNTPKKAGNVIMRNLLEGGFSGPIMPVNPRHRAVAGVLSYPTIASLPETPDLAILASPAETVPQAVAELGARGTRAAIVLAPNPDQSNKAGAASVREIAAKAGVRLLGAGSVGLLVPGAGLNASLSPVTARAGRIAFVSQSGALCTAVLDWARPKGIGFSHFISLGDCIDIDFGDVLDYLGSDSSVRAILLYIETLRERRNFMAAARHAARNKPVLVVKTHEPEAAATRGRPSTLTEIMIGKDDIYEAVIRRAGMLQVYDIDELFSAVETLARVRRITGDRLAVLANGGGLGVMAVDALRGSDAQLARLGDDTMKRLDKTLAGDWSRGNPIDMDITAPPKAYADALEILINDTGVDAILAMHAPNALSFAELSADAVIETTRQHGGLVLTSWVGGENVALARRKFAEAGLPTYDTPGQAVRAFLHMVRYNQNQEILMQTPPSNALDFSPRTDEARAEVSRALAETDGILSGPAAKRVFAAYDIPVVDSRFVRTPEEAGAAAAEIGFPCGLSVISPHILHKWEVGGVILQLGNRDAVVRAARQMLEQVGQAVPGARIDGFSLQRMTTLPHARQLIIGVATDPLFGPVMVFGHGGRSAEVLRDHAVGLLPLNVPLAADLISRTRVMRLLEAHYDRPAVDIDALCRTLVKISQLVVDIPQIVALDINPMLIAENAMLVIDAEIRANAAARTDSQRLSILPYPKRLEENATLRDGRPIVLRPIRPEDEDLIGAMMVKMSPEDIRLRYFRYISSFEHAELARMTQIDYDREMAFIATLTRPDGQAELLGVVRTITDADNDRAEFSVLVRSDLKGQGLGRILMAKMIGYARDRGTRAMIGHVLAENSDMLGLARRLGFSTHAGEDEDLVEVRLPLNQPEVVPV